MQQIGLSQLIKPIILTVDFVLMNLLFIALTLTDIITLSTIGFYQILCIINVCFLFYTKGYKPMLYSRVTRKSRIVLNITRLVVNNGVTAAAIFMLTNHTLRLGMFVIFYCCLYVVILGSHYVIRFLLKRHRKKGGNSRSCIFIGDNRSISSLYEEMTENLSSGYHVIGYFANAPADGFPTRLAYLGTTSQVVPYLTSHRVEQVYYSLTPDDDTDSSSILNYCENNMIRVYCIPYIITEFQRNAVLHSIGNVPVVSLRKEPLIWPGNILLKRSFDILFSSLFLVTLFPLIYLIIGSIIKVTSPGPILFKQKRNGRDGSIFLCYKFRSMRLNAQCDTMQATQHDTRLTPIGEFIRKTSIDELPQFINVLRGEMSVVGPRPHMVKHTREYSELINKYMIRHYVKPGITGWAQVTGFRGETKTLDQMEGRIKRDIWYIEHWSFVLDLYIIFLTVYKAFKGDAKAY